MEKQRIQKILAAAGVASRRNIEEMIRQGRISVNGSIAHKLPVLVDPQHDKIEVDGERIKLTPKTREQLIYLLLNKPKNVITTNLAQGEQVRAIDLLPPDLPGRVFPVGRLDAQSKGLLLLTNDGDLTHRLTHPRFGVAKTYRAVVAGYLSDQTQKNLQHELKIPPAQFKIVRRTTEATIIDITLREGRNALLRQSFAAAGHKVRDLARIRFGPLSLDGLPIGHVRELTAREVRELQREGRGNNPEIRNQKTGSKAKSE